MLELKALFDWNAAGNPFFHRIYHSIYRNLRFQDQIRVEHVQPDYSKGVCMSCPGGMSNFQLINPLNNKSILMSFWDRGMDVFANGLGWDKYEIVQYIGGLGMHMDSNEILNRYGVKHFPYQYPLGVKDSDLMIEEALARDAKKKNKAVFIGYLYGTRAEIAKVLMKSDKIDVFDTSAGISGQDYFDKMSEYSVAISLNGNGEFCLRDLEAFGLGMPVVRSEMLTGFFNPLIPGNHYYPASEPCPDASSTYHGMDINYVAESFVSAVDALLGDPEAQKYMGQAGRDYYLKYANTEYISDLFFETININELI